MADTFNQQLFDAMVRHQVGLLQFGSGVRNKVWKLLDATEADVRQQILERLRLDVGKPLTPARLNRMNALLASLKDTRLAAWKDVNATWLDEMKGLSLAEPGFMADTLTGIYPVDLGLALPDPARLRALVTHNPFLGATLSQWAKGEAKGDIDRIHQQIKIGMAQGEDVQQIARRVVGSISAKGVDGVTAQTRRNAEAITRTATNGVAAASRLEFAQANADLLSGELYTATLDSRTTPICASLDGNVYEVGKGPQPPMHWQCRSVRSPIVDGEVIGDRPVRNFTEKQLLREYADKTGIKAPATRDGLPRGTKGEYDAFARKRMRELTGTVPAKTSYQDWLKGQSPQFQDDILGPARGKLFRDGNLTLDKFVSPSGKTLTLKELGEFHPTATSNAGVTPPAIPGTVNGKAPPVNALDAAVQADTAAAKAASQAATQAEQAAATVAAEKAAQAAAHVEAQASASKAAAAATKAAEAAQATVDAKTAKEAKAAAAKANAAAKEAVAASEATKEAAATANAESEAVPSAVKTPPKIPTKVDYTDWVDSLSAEERKAIKGWTGNGYTSIRAAQLGKYRGDTGPFAKKAIEAAKRMTEALKRAPTRSATVYRGFGMPRKEFERLQQGGGWKLSANSSFTEKLSTAKFYSEVSDSDEDFVRVIVEARMKRAGPNLTTTGLSSHMQEHEVVGLIGQRFRIISMTKRGDTWRIVAEEI